MNTNKKKNIPLECTILIISQIIMQFCFKQKINYSQINNINNQMESIIIKTIIITIITIKWNPQLLKQL